MAKANVSKTTRRQASKPRRDRATAERRTMERKVRKMIAHLRKNPGDKNVADAVVALVDRHPFLKNIKV